MESQTNHKNFSIYTDFLVLLFLLILSVVFIAPLPWHLFSYHYGDPSDAFNLMHSWWTITKAFEKGDFYQAIYPSFQPALDFPGLILTLIFDEIFAYNLLLVLSFPLTFLAMYFFIKPYVSNPYARFLSCFLITFCPYRLAHAKGHLHLIHLEWILLYLGALFALITQPRISNFIKAVIIATAVGLSSYYYGYFIVLITPLFILIGIIYWLISKRSSLASQIENRSTKRSSLAVWLVVFSIFLLLSYPTFLIIKKVAIYKNAFSRGAIELEAYSAGIWQYFTPPLNNPLVGHAFKNFMENRLQGSNFTEIVLYLGFTALLLALYGFFKTILTKNNQAYQKLWVLSFAALAGYAFLLSLKPGYTILGYQIRMPSEILFNYVPYFRCYGRLGVFVMIAIALLAGRGLQYILENRRSISQALIFLFIFSLAGLEFANFPPFPSHPTLSLQSFRYLSEQPGTIRVLELPFREDRTYAFTRRDAQHQIIDMKQLAFQLDLKSTSLRNKILEAQSLGLTKILANFKALNQEITHILVHTEFYKPEISEKTLQGLSLKELKRFGTDLIYSVEWAPEGVFYWLSQDFAEPEEEQGRSFRSASDRAFIILQNTHNSDVQTVLTFQIASLNRPRILQILDDKNVISENLIETSWSEINLEQNLSPGRILLRLKQKNGAEARSRDYIWKTSAFSIKEKGFQNMLSIAYGRNFYEEESEAGIPYRWMSNSGELIMKNNFGKNRRVLVEFKAASLAKPRSVQILFKGEFLTQIQVPVEPIDISLPEIELQPGANRIRLDSDPPAQVADEIYNNNDLRAISIQLRNLRVTALAP